MKEEMIEVVDEYNKEGFLVKKTFNGIPFPIPKDVAPQVQFINLDTEWVVEKFYMTKEEVKEKFGEQFSYPTNKSTGIWNG